MLSLPSKNCPISLQARLRVAIWNDFSYFRRWMEEGDMREKMRIMSEKPLNAETPTEGLRSWITPNSLFFKRNQGDIMKEPISLEDYHLNIQGEVARPLRFDFPQISRMPKATVANTLECSGNGRSLFSKKAAGNPWTTGGVGNAIWGGIWLRDLLEKTGLKKSATHVAFEGLDTPLGTAGVKFIRSIPLAKCMSTTLLAYEMNGEPLPAKHGYPLRALALGWTGANCVKWLHKITVLDRPFEGFYMDNVYRVFQKGEEPKTGTVVTNLKIKSIITQPLPNATLQVGPIAIMGAAYAGENDIERVEVSLDNGVNWNLASLIGPHEPFAWRHWQYVSEAMDKGSYTLMARATDSEGRQQPMNAQWNVLGYGNNGIKEHSVTINLE
jgi:DMSO/TMAO reductase YedYZ molybdopterin-dependent catalytic subunit